MYDLLIRNAVIVTVDPQHRVFENGYIAVRGNTIAAIGAMEELPEEVQAAKVIDAKGKAVLPGLIDGHGHGGHCLTRTLGDQYANWDDMAEEIYFHYTDDDFWYAEAALAAA
ncbi:MAG: amidohydrolase, partial [Clostridia bacterium]|nr:amidohydrolase [Clostridia bacterium]